MKRWRLCLTFWTSSLVIAAASAAQAQIEAGNPENIPTVTLTAQDALPAALLQTLTTITRAIADQAQDQDAIEVSRLRQRALDATISTLHTQGYFSPQVDLKVVQSKTGENWHLTIHPGSRTHVSQIDWT